MEWYDIIKDLISTLGFPIFACCYMFYLNTKLTDTFNELKNAINELRDRL